MSALPPEADIHQRIEHVCFVPKADICGLCYWCGRGGKIGLASIMNDTYAPVAGIASIQGLTEASGATGEAEPEAESQDWPTVSDFATPDRSDLKPARTSSE
jgi:hypothetical protein